MPPQNVYLLFLCIYMCIVITAVVVTMDTATAKARRRRISEMIKYKFDDVQPIRQNEAYGKVISCIIQSKDASKVIQVYSDHTYTIMSVDIKDGQAFIFDAYGAIINVRDYSYDFTLRYFPGLMYSQLNGEQK